ncbi:class I SAM-dependent methyltransferase [Methanobacterium formicicum]|uniref:Type 12 methyltransferase n=1 Tax=Methanobacterium formicicum (strain DSM 3637 / PP1) TaxID=1204725 RepID=K2RA74_METFP|nr:class I SAM-dependent methyltransferase [Methanobacterium formicicum]EKF85219.1 type 12 methyltransferase [Methanobacterium formicicum DSM 3637]
MAKQELYRKFAQYYDLIYKWMDYEGEAEFVEEMVELHKFSPGNNLLDVACGTGNHAQYLTHSFQVVGLDINPEMMEIAHEKVPEMELVTGNMQDMDFEMDFDVIICLFSAINYNTNLNDLSETLERFYKHLKVGGVLIFDLGFCTENWDEGRVFVDAVAEEDIQLARISQSHLRDGVFNANFVFLVKEDGIMDFEVDQHDIGVFSTPDVCTILDALGFDFNIYGDYENISWDENSGKRPVFVCVKS